MEEFELKVDDSDAGMRLDRWLSKAAQDQDIPISRTWIQKLIAEGKITSGSIKLKPHYKVKANQVFKIIFDQPQADSKLEAQDIPLDIVYQDDDLAVINKPSGLVVHPGAGNKNNTLVNSLIFHFKNLSSINPLRPGIVHRLDKDTSGLMVVVKNDKTHLALAEQFSVHSVKRCYVALVKGTVEFDENIIEMPITRHSRDRKKMAVGFVEGAKYAKTRYRTLKRSKDASLLKLIPFTGRTHQLRVHLAFIGHPILGDIKYGKHNKFTRLALHATDIGFTHPTSNKFIEFSTPIPEEFLKYLDSL